MIGKTAFLRRVLIALIIVCGLIIVGGFGYFALGNNVVVYADGDATQVRGSFDSAESILTAAEIEVKDGDIVVPNDLAETSALTVLRAKSVNVIIDGEPITYTTHQSGIGAFLTETQIEIQRSDRVLADGKPILVSDWSSAPLPATLEIERLNLVNVIDDGALTQLETSVKTVGEALAEANVTLYAADGVEPALGDWISADTTITIKRSTPYTILVDGRTIETRSHHTNPLAVLSEVGIGLVGSDYVRPNTDGANSTIEVVRVTDEFVIDDSPIPFESSWQGTDQLEIDDFGVLIAGKSGVLRTRTRIVYENGVEVERVPEGEWVAETPTNEVIGYGTNIVIRTLDSADGPIEYWRKVRMRVTSYTAASSGKAADHPAYGITYTGVPAGKGVVAIDPTVVGLRTNLYVQGYGVGYAGDTGGGVKGRWIDLGWDEHNYESWWGFTDVYFMTPIPAENLIKYLIPRELPPGTPNYQR